MSAPLSDLSVDSVTGIDVSLPIAGPGARAYAFVIDWHIRVMLAVGWFVLGALLYNGRWSLAAPPGSDARGFALVVMPALCLYFLYHPLLEVALRGSTPGKRTAGVRIVTRDGAAPGVGALLVRNVFRLVDSLPAAYSVGLVLVMLTREHVRCGDMAAGTLLVYERAAVAPPGGERLLAVNGRLDAAGAELVAELLERWPSLEPAARVRLARRMLERYGAADALAAGGDDSEISWRARLERLATRSP